MQRTSARRLAGATLAALTISGALAISSTLAGPALAEPIGDAAPSRVEARTRAFSGFDNSVILAPGAPQVTMSLDVPAGKYTVSAKVTARLVGGASEDTVDCRLVVLGGVDESVMTVSQLLNLQTMALQVVDELTSPRAIRLICDKSKEASTVELTSVKITALKVQSASVVPLDVT